MHINIMALKRFPIGVQDFARIREDGMYYVDKTDLVYKLTHTDLYYFLSRPRRFGKSLLVSTLQYYFEGRKDLFSGLALARCIQPVQPDKCTKRQGTCQLLVFHGHTDHLDAAYAQVQG